MNSRITSAWLYNCVLHMQYKIVIERHNKNEVHKWCMTVRILLRWVVGKQIVNSSTEFGASV
jgi:hypothetical protein